MIFPQFKATRLHELLHEEWGDLRIPGLLDLIARTRPRSMVEVGAFRGVSTEVFLLHAANVTTIDPFFDIAVERDFKRRCGGYPHLQVMKGVSLNVLPLLNGPVDFCYLDGDHSYETVLFEIKECKRLLHPDGWLAGHDYMGLDTPGVARAVLEFAPAMRIETFSDSSWAVRVKDITT